MMNMTHVFVQDVLLNFIIVKHVSHTFEIVYTGRGGEVGA
jgi:hypothetical protein